jgi:hypothetical protein
MNSEIYDDIAIEETAREQFGKQLDIKQVIVRNAPTSHTTAATVFLTTKGQLYALVSGRAPLTLGDVRKIIRRMGMTADAYLPPKHEPHYFDKVAEEKFRDVFPGRTSVSDQDLLFYRLLAPYNPALVRIAVIDDGVIRQFDSADSSNWRVVAKFAYKRIKTV